MAGQKTAIPMHCTSLMEDFISALERDISEDCYWKEGKHSPEAHTLPQQVNHALHTASLGLWNISHLLVYVFIIFSNNEQGYASFNRTPSTGKNSFVQLS